MSRIMVIDDDSMTLRLVERALTAEGFEVTTWSTEHDALEQLEREQPDLVLLDTHLGFPNNGWGILHQLRFNDATVRLPVIMWSADEQFLVEKEKWIRGMGAAMLVKPLDMARLVCMIVSMVGCST